MNIPEHLKPAIMARYDQAVAEVKTRINGWVKQFNDNEMDGCGHPECVMSDINHEALVQGPLKTSVHLAIAVWMLSQAQTETPALDESETASAG